MSITIRYADDKTGRPLAIAIERNATGKFIKLTEHRQQVITRTSGEMAETYNLYGRLHVLDDDDAIMATCYPPRTQPTQPQGLGQKHDSGKPEPVLLMGACGDAIDSLIAVLTYGARKYSPDNWKRVEELENRYLNAALRHLNADRRTPTDPESGLPHLAHAIVSLIFILQNRLDRADPYGPQTLAREYYRDRSQRETPSQPQTLVRE